MHCTAMFHIIFFIKLDQPRYLASNAEPSTMQIVKISVKMCTLYENCITKMYELILIGFIIKWCHRVVDSQHYYYYHYLPAECK